MQRNAVLFFGVLGLGAVACAPTSMQHRADLTIPCCIAQPSPQQDLNLQQRNAAILAAQRAQEAEQRALDVQRLEEHDLRERPPSP